MFRLFISPKFVGSWPLALPLLYEVKQALRLLTHLLLGWILR